MVDAGAIAHLAQMSLNPDSKLKVSVMKIITDRKVFENKLRSLLVRDFIKGWTPGKLGWSFSN